MKVLISGGGIAGNALAFWLSRLGHNVTVIERFSSLRTTGLQIDLRGHGIEVMKRMGLEQDFRSKSVPEQGLQVVDKSGRRRAFFPANRSGKGLQSFTTDYEIMRGDLCHLFYDATKDRARYVFGTSIKSFEEKAGYIEVQFADGNVEQFDLLVGADGSGSRIRKMMLGPGAADAFQPLGDSYVAYFTIPQPIPKGGEYTATMFMAPGNRGIMTRRSNPDTLQVYLGCTSDSERLRSRDVKEQKEALAEICSGAGWQMEEILKGMMGTDDFYCERMGLVKLDTWSRNRVVLIGDAAYCPSANTGMGVTSSVVGAYILAGEIGKHRGSSNGEDAGGVENARGSLEAALKSYEEKFQPFMTQVQKGISADSGLVGSKLFSTAFGIGIMNCLAGIVSFLKLNLIAEWFLKEDVKGWDLPEYEGMNLKSDLPGSSY